MQRIRAGDIAMRIRAGDIAMITSKISAFAYSFGITRNYGITVTVAIKHLIRITVTIAIRITVTVAIKQLISA